MIVTGRVQGVFFRESCKQLARAAHVNGWVRNQRDGTVEAVFEGEPDDVAALVEWCRVGPPVARVENVSVTDEPPQDEGPFRVTR